MQCKAGRSSPTDGTQPNRGKARQGKARQGKARQGKDASAGHHTWIPADVFILPFYAPRVEFPLKTGRAIFHGNGFPFSEKYFNEWYERQSFSMGRNAEIIKLPGSWIGDKSANHYRLLAPGDFLEEAKRYRIDWVVIETDYSEKFSGCKADFDSPEYKAYSLSALKLCVR